MGEKKYTVNGHILILQFFGILFVVCGHAGVGGVLGSDLFRFTSFHMPLFIFISGYLYKTQSENNIGDFIYKKAKRLIVPMYVWIGLYAVLCTLFKKLGLLSYGLDHSWFNFFIEPWAVTARYGLTDAYWFIPVLFMIHSMNAFIRTGFKISESFSREIIYMVLTFAGSLYAVYEAQKMGGWFGAMNRIQLIMVHVGFLLPFYQMGHLFATLTIRDCKDDRKKLMPLTSDTILVSISAASQLLIMALCGGYNKMYNTVIYADFGVNPLLSIAMAVNGVIFWYFLTKIMYSALLKYKMVSTVGSSTMAILLNHQFGIFVFNWILYLITEFTQHKIFIDINVERIVSMSWYTYNPENMIAFKWLYVVFSVLFSITLYNGYRIGVARATTWARKILRIFH